jgi:hypothetical protein
MREKFLNTMHDNTCVKVYDPNADPKLIGVFSSYNKAGNILGISPSTVHQKCVSKLRVYSPNLQKEVAIRLSAMKEEDKKLILKNRFL